jgi:3-hydroxyisobutyrate dehydrogenase-like beta-hydroxyacid dehydrogenase
MLRRDFVPGFYVEHFIKDLDSFGGIKKNEIRFTRSLLASSLYQALSAQGFEEKALRHY